RRIARRPDISRRVVDSALGRVALAHDAELGGQDHLVAFALEEAADQLLVVAMAIGVGGVEEIDAGGERGFQGRQRFRIVPWPIELGHAHAAETERGYRKAAAAERAVLHETLLGREMMRRES